MSARDQQRMRIVSPAEARTIQAMPLLENDEAILAATIAALDPKRREDRLDILTESALRVLSTSSIRLDTSAVTARAGNLWNSRSIPTPLVDDALCRARAAGYVEGDSAGWQLTAEGKQATDTDTAHANAVVDRFDAAVALYVEEESPGSLTETQMKALAKHVRLALFHAAQGLYNMKPSGMDSVRPASFREGDALSYIHSNVQPKSRSDLAIRLVVKAMHPADDFGNEYLHLLATGNVLHAFVNRRDVSKPQSFRESRLLLDTSALVPLMNGDADPTRIATLKAIEMAKAAGAQVIVAEHTLEEWERLWVQADGEVRGRTVGVLGAAPLVRCAPVSAFMVACEANPDLTWSAFSAEWRSITPILKRLGITVRKAYNDTPQDRQLARLIRDEMDALVAEYAQQRNVDPCRIRTNSALLADVESAVMIARWRAKGIPHCYFLATDSITPRAYRNVSQDALPFGCTPAAWVLFAASLTTEDPSAAVQIAEVVGNAAVHDSFLAIASIFTLEEIQRLAAALEDNGAIDSDTLADAVQASFDQLHADSTMGAVSIGDLVVTRSTQRRARRMRRNEELVAEQLARAQAEKVNALSAAAEAQRRHELELTEKEREIAERAAKAHEQDTLLREQQQRLDRLEQRQQEELAQAAERTLRWKRTVIVIAALAVAIAALAGATALTTWGGPSLYVAAATVLVILTVGGIAWIRNLKTNVWALIGTLVFSVAVNILTNVVALPDGSPSPPVSVSTTVQLDR